MGARRERATVEETAHAAESSDGGGTPGDNLVIRVRRGALRRFDHLSAKSTGLPVEVKWDRRVSDRREAQAESAGNRRRGERRQKPPYTWDAADFLVVGDSSRPDEDPQTDDSPKKKR